MIHPGSGKLVVSSELSSTPYGKLEGKLVNHKLAPASLSYQYTRFQSAQLDKADDIVSQPTVPA